MLCGVIAYAVAIEEAVAHPGEPLLLEGRLALGIGIALFIVGTAAAVWRATGSLLLPRIALIGAAALALILLADVKAGISLAIAMAGIVAVAFMERNLSHQVETVEIMD